MEFCYYVTQLTPEERSLYNSLYAGLSEMAECLTLPCDAGTLHKVMRAVLLDHPELYWFDGKWRGKQETGVLQVMPNYTLSQPEAAAVTQRMEQTVGPLLQSLPRDEVACVRKLYDWFLSNVSYQYSQNDQKATGALLDRKAVCKGISRAFQLCMNRLGIPSLLVEGTLDGAVMHVWNLVFLHGQPYHVDVAIGNPRFSGLFAGHRRNLRYPCFLVSDRTLSQTHRMYDRFPFACREDRQIGEILENTTHIPERFRSLGTVRYLDSGSTCHVFQIHGDRECYALKVMEAHGNAAAFSRAQQELQRLIRLSGCDGVVPALCWDVDEQNQQISILMPWYRSLPAWRKSGKLGTLQEAVSLGLDLLQALQTLKAHGLYHLDVQPKNIYFDASGKALLGDLGNCAEHLEGLPKQRGTLSFMAPEVYHDGKYSEGSELYALGMVLYSLLNHAKLPFEDCHSHEDALQLRLSGARLPELKIENRRLAQCIGRMCEFDPALRYDSYLSAMTALKQCQDD